MTDLLTSSGDWASHPLWFQTAGILVQFLWQACALTVLLLVFERQTRPVGARVRYRRSLVTLLAIAVAPVFTLAASRLPEARDSAPASTVTSAVSSSGVVEPPIQPSADGSHDSSATGEPQGTGTDEEWLITTLATVDATSQEAVRGDEDNTNSNEGALASTPVHQPVDEASADSEADSPPSIAPSRFSLKIPWWVLPAMTSLWLTGTGVLLLRLLFGTCVIRSWARRASPLPPPALRIAERVAARLSLRRMPGICTSREVAEPLAAGLFSPRIFVPADWLTLLSDDCLEAILAHELAHVRRGDLRVNLVQRLIEALWFFHPAVWWLTRRIRRERELCCDREAVSATGNPMAYAAALEFVVERALAACRPGVATGMGDDSMAVLRRVKAVLGAPSDQPTASWWRVGLLSAAIPAGLWLGSISLIPAAAGDGKEDPPPARAENGTDDEDDGPREPRRDPPPREREDRPGPRRPEGERREEGERPRPPRDGGPRDGGPRDGGPRDGGPREEGRRDDRPRDDRHGDGERREEGRRERGDGPRPPQHDGPANDQMMRLIHELREEINELRREVRELRGNRGPGPDGRGDRPREGERRGPDGDRREGDRDRPRPVDRDGFRPPKENFVPPRDGQPRREGAPKEGGPRRDGDRRPEGERGPRDGAPREAGPRDGGPRPEGRPPEGERREGDRRPDGPPREGLPRDAGPRDGDRRPPEGERRPPRDGERKPDNPPPPRREERKPEPPPERKSDGDKPADRKD